MLFFFFFLEEIIAFCLTKQFLNGLRQLLWKRRFVTRQGVHAVRYVQCIWLESQKKRWSVCRFFFCPFPVSYFPFGKLPWLLFHIALYGSRGHPTFCFGNWFNNVGEGRKDQIHFTGQTHKHTHTHKQDLNHFKFFWASRKRGCSTLVPGVGSRKAVLFCFNKEYS